MEDDFTEISHQNYNKMSATIKKNGFADGVHAGRESVFQPGFDTGYSEGFKNGFNLGQKSAASRLKSANQPENIETGSTKPTRGNCILCVDSSLISQPLDNIILKQNQRMVQ